jgi:hypothetical protein
MTTSVGDAALAQALIADLKPSLEWSAKDYTT